jgi:hypothetical protein
MAAAAMNSLKVRRVDLLEQLQERYVFMTTEKEKYDKAKLKYEQDDEAYELAEFQYEKDVRAYLHNCVKLDKLDYSIRHDSYNRSCYRVTADTSVDVSEAQVIRAVGKHPTRPKEPQRPVFLQNRRGRSWSDETLSVYEAVYQAIQVLNMSNDEEVKAQMFNDALTAL